MRLVTLAEKLLVPLLVKLTNLVPDSGIWLNTQRPEWNDANNALAGWGLSLVTLNAIVRYVGFLRDAFADDAGRRALGLRALAAGRARRTSSANSICPFDDAARFAAMRRLGHAGEAHREAVYARALGEPVATLECRPSAAFLDQRGAAGRGDDPGQPAT